MKQLKDIVIEMIKESVFDMPDRPDDVLIQDMRNSIKQFLDDNYHESDKCKISKLPNKDGKFVVDCTSGISVKNPHMESLTNGLFVFGKVSGTFYLTLCDNLTSLEGAPQNVRGPFVCSFCNNLKSLEGAPQKVAGIFSCRYCRSLTSLKGAPQDTVGGFDCCMCDSLTSLEGAPRNVRGKFICSFCNNLKSLKGAPQKVGDLFNCQNTQITSLEHAPKIVGGDFRCDNCASKFTRDDVLKYSKVNSKIYC
jgi:hypothetical protein